MRVPIRRLLISGVLVLLLGLGACEPTPSPTLPAATPTPAAPAALETATPVPTPTRTFMPIAMVAGLPAPLSYQVSRESGETELRLIDDAGDRALASDREGFATLIWSPDGRRGAAVLLSSVERALVLIDIATKEVRRTLTVAPADRLSFRPAANWSRLVALQGEAGRNQLWSVDVPDGATHHLTSLGGSLIEWAISGDGRWALASIEAENHVVTSLFDGEGRQAIEISSMPHPLVEFSEDGRWLALAGREAGETLMKVALWDLNAPSVGDAVRIVAVGTTIQPALSRPEGGARFFTGDGSWLACVIEDGSGTRVRLRELAGETRFELTLESDEHLSWLTVYPSLRRALLASGNASAEERLRLLYLDQRVAVPLLEHMAKLTLLSDSPAGHAVIDAVQADGQHVVAMVDVPRGSSHIVLRGWLRPLAVDWVGRRALVALGAGGSEEVHLLDLNVGGTLVYFGRSSGGSNRPAVGEFAPAGPAVWVRLYQPDGLGRLVVAGDSRGPAVSVADGVADTRFSPDGTMLVWTKEPAHGDGIYLVRADGSEPRFVASGRAPRWHPKP